MNRESSQRLKVLRVIARLNVGGPARHVVLLNRGLELRGFDTQLVYGSVAAEEASLEHLATSGGLRVTKVEELGPRINALSDARAFVKLVGLAFSEQPDIIHTHTAKAGTLGRLAALVYNALRRRSHRALIVHTFHGHVLTGYFGEIGSRLVRLAERQLAHVSDCIITISSSQRRDICERFRIAPGYRVTMIPLGLDLSVFQSPYVGPSLREALGIPAGDVVVGYVGRFVHIKDIPTLVEAFGGALHEVPHMWLMLAGDGPTRPEIEATARRTGCFERLRFLGWTEDLPAVYASMDICALSSINEGTPVAIIEAMAAGKPVVSTNAGGVSDIVTENRTGLLTPVGDAQALAGSIVALARNPVDRAAMGRSARRAVLGRFSPERLVDDVARLYETALREKRAT